MLPHLSRHGREFSASDKIANAARRAVRNPSWLRETVRTKLRARADRDRPFSLTDHPEHVCSVADALGDAFGVTEREYRLVASRVRIPPAPDGSVWGGGPDILNLTGSVVLLRRPSVVLETGVAMGFTTAVILSAMEENDEGALHSIDLPPLQVDAATYVGKVIPHELRGRWRLQVGPTRTFLPRLARELAPIDLFVHDSDHSYAAQYEEYHLMWPHLSEGGCMISDDVSNPAFTEFAAQVAEKPYLVASPGQNGAVGLLVKTR
jgi:predicted O-methyltransferase YrrM